MSGERKLDPGAGPGDPAEAGERQWTVMLYLAGDNNLESFGRADLMEAKAVGSTSEVAIVAQFDRMREGQTRRYYLRRDTSLEADEVPSNLGETNTGDPRELVYFFDWATSHYPAQRYALVLWNHGAGWKEDDIYRLAKSAGIYRDHLARTLSPLIVRLVDRTQRPPIFAGTVNAVLARGIAYDDTSCDFLDNAEMKRAISCGLLASGIDKLDVLGFDACLMNMLEVAYQMRDATRFMVGSQETEPGEGWPYQPVLQELVDHPEMDGEGLTTAIVEHYVDSYGAGHNLTQSALNVEQVREVVLALNEVCAYVLENQETCELAIGRASRKAQRYADPDYMDLCDFCRLLVERTDDVLLKRKVQAVIDLLDPAGPGRFVCAEAHYGLEMARSHGVSIYFPGHVISPFYGRLDFAAESLWDELLQRMFGIY
jgi:hypothetical protein